MGARVAITKNYLAAAKGDASLFDDGADSGRLMGMRAKVEGACKLGLLPQFLS